MKREDGKTINYKVTIYTVTGANANDFRNGLTEPYTFEVELDEYNFPNLWNCLYFHQLDLFADKLPVDHYTRFYWRDIERIHDQIEQEMKKIVYFNVVEAEQTNKELE